MDQFYFSKVDQNSIGIDSRPLWLIDEVFLGQSEGLWQYALTVATETWFVQDWPQEALPLTREAFMKTENNEVAYGEVSLQR